MDRRQTRQKRLDSTGAGRSLGRREDDSDQMDWTIIPERLSFCEFYCRVHVYSRPDWANARREGNTRQLREAARRILEAARKSCGRQFDPEKFTRFEDLEKLVGKWERAWLISQLI